MHRASSSVRLPTHRLLPSTRWLLFGSIASLLASVAKAQADDWLPPESPEVSAAPRSTGTPGRMFLEAMADVAQVSQPGTNRHHGNLGLDWSLNSPFGESFRLQTNGRVDLDMQPAAGLSHNNLSLSLRELYANTQSGSSDLDFGRITVRDGVAVGYNPSDVFRAGSLPIRRTNDPSRLRESRLGVVGLRGTLRGSPGDFAILLAPRLHRSSQPAWYDPNLGAVNEGRAQAYAKYTPPRWGDVYSSVIAHGREDGGRTLAFNVSSNLGRSVVAYAELARTRVATVADLVTDTDAARRAVTQGATGLSWTSQHHQTVTVEYAFNGAGLTREQWRGAWQTAPVAGLERVFASSTSQQDPLGQDSLMVMLQWDRFLQPDADLTCLVRRSLVDISRLTWCEWRYKQQATEWGLSLTQLSGRSRSEFGSAGIRYSLGAKARFFF